MARFAKNHTAATMALDAPIAANEVAAFNRPLRWRLAIIASCSRLTLPLMATAVCGFNSA